MARIPGVQGRGCGGVHGVDKGTLALTRHGTRGPINGNNFCKPGISCAIPISETQQPLEGAGFRVASIYFETDKYNLDTNDINALNTLCKYLKELLSRGYLVELDIEGGADHRGTEINNFELGLLRCSEVLKYIKTKIKNPNLHILASSTGEEKAKKPQKNKRLTQVRLRQDRRADVYISWKKPTPAKVKKKDSLNKTKEVPVQWIEKTFEYHSGHAGKIVTKTRILIREKYKNVPEDWVKYGQTTDELERGNLPGGDVYYITRYWAVYKTPDGLYYSEKIGEVGAKVFNFLTFNLEGVVKFVYKSWDNYPRKGDDPLNNYRP